MKPGAVVLIVVGAFFILFFPHYIVQWTGYAVVLLVAVSFAYARIVDAALQVSRTT